MAKLVDPVEEKDKEKKAGAIVGSIKSINDLTFSDLQAIPQRAAQMAHPFDGYPYEKIKVGTYEGKDFMVMSAFLVILFPAFQPPQDISGVGVTIKKAASKTKRGDIIPEHEEIVTIKTNHNVIVVDYDNAKQNTDVVFDREFELSEGKKVLGAIVPSHSVRAQLMFRYDPKKERVFVNEKYVLVDVRQQNKLRKVFDIVMFDKLRSEKLSKQHYKED